MLGFRKSNVRDDVERKDRRVAGYEGRRDYDEYEIVQAIYMQAIFEASIRATMRTSGNTVGAIDL